MKPDPTDEAAPACKEAGPITLEDVIATSELSRRPSRPPDYQAESLALAALMQAIAEANLPVPGQQDSADRILRQLAEVTLQICRAQSSGLSILEEANGREVFRWQAVVGQCEGFQGGAIPRERSPCGVVLEQDAAILMVRPERYYSFLRSGPPLVETLLVPFHYLGKPMGTLWVIAHDDSRKFDAEDVRLLSRLSQFAGVAYQLLESHQQRLATELAAMTHLHELVTRLVDCRDLDVALSEVLSATMDISGAQMGSIQLRNPEDATLSIVAEQGLSPLYLDHFRIVQAGDGSACSRAMSNRERVVISDVEQDLLFAPHRQAAAQIGFRAVQCTPLVCRAGKLLGVLSTHYRQPYSPGPRELRILDLYCRQAADFIARVRAEEEIHAAKVLAENIIETLHTPLVVLTDEFRVQAANPSYYHHFQTSPADTLGRGFYELGNGQWDIPQLRQLLGEVLPADKAFHDVEIEHEFAQLGWRTLLLDGRRIDHVGLILLGIRDITERKCMEQTLRESEQRFRVLVEAASQAVWETDTEGVVVKDSPSWRAYTGQTIDEWLGYGWLEAVHPEDREHAEQQWRVAASEGRTYDIEYRLRSPQGDWRWTNARGAPIRDPEGNITKWVGMNFDITERKRAEQALQEADRRKSEFLAMLAHELRNPMAPIRSAAEFLAMADLPDPDLRESVAVIDRQVTHMTRLVDDLLDVSRINCGKIQLRKQRVEIRPLIMEAIKSCSSLVGSLRHQVTIALPSEPVYLEVDPVRLRQVVTNLFNNACKYTPPEGHIWVTAAREDELAVIRVRDNGIGIPPERLEEVFEPFSQLNQSLERSQGGLGIGLSLVKQLVAMHGGSVEAKSAGEQHGSEFVVRLPISAITPESSEAAPAAAVQAGLALRILVVDDNRDAAYAISKLLKLLGQLPQTAFDGPEALEAARQWKPDVILLDIGMPGMNGYEVCKLIRQEPWGKEAAIIALTGWGQEEDFQRSREAGFDHHLVKPVDRASLGLVLSKLARAVS